MARHRRRALPPPSQRNAVARSGLCRHDDPRAHRQHRNSRRTRGTAARRRRADRCACWSATLVGRLTCPVPRSSRTTYGDDGVRGAARRRHGPHGLRARVRGPGGGAPLVRRGRRSGRGAPGRVHLVRRRERPQRFLLGRDHAATEQAIRDSGLDWTFLRDNFYAEVLPTFADADGVIRGPAGPGRVAPVSQRDVAAVAAAVLGDPREPRRATYDLTGPEALTLDEVAERPDPGARPAAHLRRRDAGGGPRQPGRTWERPTGWSRRGSAPTPRSATASWARSATTCPGCSGDPRSTLDAGTHAYRRRGPRNAARPTRNRGSAHRNPRLGERRPAARRGGQRVGVVGQERRRRSRRRSCRAAAGTISVSMSMSGRNRSARLLTPPPTTNSSGLNSFSKRPVVGGQPLRPRLPGQVLTLPGDVGGPGLGVVPVDLQVAELGVGHQLAVEDQGACRSRCRAWSPAPRRCDPWRRRRRPRRTRPRPRR